MLTNYIHFAADFSKKHGHMPELDDDHAYIKNLDCRNIEKRVKDIPRKGKPGYGGGGLRCDGLNENKDGFVHSFFEISYFTEFNGAIIDKKSRDITLRKDRSYCSLDFTDFIRSRHFFIEKDEKIHCRQTKWLRLGQ